MRNLGRRVEIVIQPAFLIERVFGFVVFELEALVLSQMLFEAGVDVFVRPANIRNMEPTGIVDDQCVGARDVWLTS